MNATTHIMPQGRCLFGVSDGDVALGVYGLVVGARRVTECRGDGDGCSGHLLHSCLSSGGGQAIVGSGGGGGGSGSHYRCTVLYKRPGNTSVHKGGGGT